MTPEQLDAGIAQLHRIVNESAGYYFGGELVPFAPEFKRLALSALESLSADAGRWRAVIGSARVRALGCSRLGEHDQHIGFELWETYPYPNEIDNTASREWLLRYADTAAARMNPHRG